MIKERDSLSAAPGSSPPVVPPSVAAAPQSCRDAPPPERRERKQVESGSRVATLIQINTKEENSRWPSLLIAYMPVQMLLVFLRSSHPARTCQAKLRPFERFHARGGDLGGNFVYRN